MKRKRKAGEKAKYRKKEKTGKRQRLRLKDWEKLWTSGKGRKEKEKLSIVIWPRNQIGRYV